MILVFGGTTEGRIAVEVLEESGTAYYYSTKTGEQSIALHHGVRLCGALDVEAMRRFCSEHEIRLIVDAAHPFAALLHHTVAHVSESLGIPAVRYERIYPPRDPDIVWIDSYDEIPRDIHSLLATTGVQSIARLKPLESGMKVFYRILNRESSVALAQKQGAKPEQLCYYEGSDDIPVKAEAILLKESGQSGGFSEKVEAARSRGMRIIALKRPETPEPFIQVNGPYGLRRAVEKLVPTFFPLHSGLTTGTCATAAAVAALLPSAPSEVPVVLPNGETIRVPVGYGDGYAYCIKESGDDPDVTNGLEIRARVTPGSSAPSQADGSEISIVGGEGVGTFTLPGFDYPPGSPAINKGPREMIRSNVTAAANSSLFPLPSSLTITISVPLGAETARRTFNPRLGIAGGISIIGVSGIVKPFSEEAFVSAIRKCLEVAKASGASRVVVNSGAKSERFLKALYPDLPAQAFVQYGNYIGQTLTIAASLGISNVTLGVMLGKAVKLAAGHLDTHSRKAVMDVGFVRSLLRESDIDVDIGGITLARELWSLIPASKLDAFVATVVSHCLQHCRPLLPDGSLTILLIDDDGTVYS